MHTDRISIFVSVIILALFIGATAFGDVPDLINYQGYLSDDVGYPITDPALDMEFSLWDDASNTDPIHQLWIEIWDSGTSEVSVIDGYCSVLLGSYEPFESLFDDHDDLWLEIVVNGETLTPRKRIASTAYAQRTKGITVKDGDVGIGTDTPSASLEIERSGTATFELTSTISPNGRSYRFGTGPAGALWVIDRAENVRRLIIDSNGNVDIGTSEVGGSDLTVYGDLIVSGTVTGGTVTATSVPWLGITGIPDGFADGTDDGIESESDPTVAASVKDGVDFSELSGAATDAQIPDDITITEADPTVAASVKDGVDFSELSGAATDVQIPNNVTIYYAASAGTASATPWSGVTGMPGGFSDGTDDEGTADYGIEITQAMLPYNITESGNYYLTGNLSYGGTVDDAIDIWADDVTLDLNGFTLTGLNTFTKNGISDNTSDNVTIRNGTIRDFGRASISAAGKHWRVLNIRVIHNGHYALLPGLDLYGEGAVIDQCVAAENAGKGINTGSGASITRSTSMNNGSSGISAGSGSLVTGNVTSFNGGSGIYVNGTGSTIMGNFSYSNTNHGISSDAASLVKNNTAYGNVNFGIQFGDYSLSLTNVAYDNGTNMTSSCTGCMISASNVAP